MTGHAVLIERFHAATLPELERAVEDSMDRLMEGALALKEIRDRELYKPGGHATLEAYAKHRFGFAPQFTHGLVRSAQMSLFEKPKPNGRLKGKPTPPRGLARVPDERKQAVWDRAGELAAEAGEPITDAHVEHAHQEFRQRVSLLGDKRLQILRNVKASLSSGLAVFGRLRPKVEKLVGQVDGLIERVEQGEDDG